MALSEHDTIVAVATPEGRGGLAIVRLSGPRALTVARRLLSGRTLREPVRSHHARLATLRWPSPVAADEGHDETTAAAGRTARAGLAASQLTAPGTPLDRALVLPLLAPASYTGEDTVEFICHGGLLPARLVTAACRAAGARAATAGEFTRRAFLNGRLSLAQAEAVADLIAAEHAAAAGAALAQLRGGLNRQLAAVEQPLRHLLADLEGALEFGADVAVGPAPDAVRAVLRDAEVRVAALLALGTAGRQLRDGVQVALTGPPNAGKSSLFNALLDRPRALVDTEPGTTRDVISAPLELDGLLFLLHDTAGLHAGASGVEALGIERARQQIATADIILDLRPVGAAGQRDAGDPAVATATGTVVRVWTKGDLGEAPDGLVTSASTGQGVGELRQWLLAEARRRGIDESLRLGIVLNQRHEDRLRSCRDVLSMLLDEPSVGDEVIAGMLATVLQDLGSVSGRVFTERLLDDVFTRFCVGK
jgi:tRNA modification GTPase